MLWNSYAALCAWCVRFVFECAVCTEVVALHSALGGYPPGFSKLVIRKASRREWEKKESRWRPLFFNEIFDIFSLCFQRRDKGDREGGRGEWMNKCGRLPADWVTLRCVWTLHPCHLLGTLRDLLPWYDGPSGVLQDQGYGPPEDIKPV